LGTDDELFEAVVASPDDSALRVVYADWLEQRGDPRAAFLRLHDAVAPLPPDEPDRLAREAELSRLRLGIDRGWLAVIEPERVKTAYNTCDCFTGAALELHREPQNTECDGWKKLCDLVEDCAAKGREEFTPIRHVAHDEWRTIVTLPPTIAKLTSVTRMVLYQSWLVRIPREIGEMTSLSDFHPYTSYRLHWFPYEITRCRALADSTVSTRTLYGNFKFRPPFPALEPPRDRGPMRPCSVCDRPFEDRREYRRWISLEVATDVLPLLVNACSQACLDRAGTPPEGYVATPHRGGPDLVQPPRR